ncbi:MAG: hypothetical protein IKW89_10475 [Bacteroidales bacterium]|nr:hypothetical protein [Bacteroidales bacterium]
MVLPSGVHRVDELSPVGTPFASLTPAPPNAIVVLAPLRLAVVGPLPLPLSGGGQVLQGKLLDT